MKIATVYILTMTEILSKSRKNKFEHNGYLYIFDACSKADPKYFLGYVNNGGDIRQEFI